ncbi:MAG TPA: GMC family oxidoreductase [Gemmatimonadaceae bacterium]|nr:GMC family oxidoreductase [Gemmatimonadaceae bacterium]
MSDVDQLTDSERDTLRAVCEAFHPSLPAAGADDQVLFGTSALDVGVPQAAERAIAILPAIERAEVRQLLRLMDGRMFGALLCGVPRGIVEMSDGEREQLLVAMSTRRLPQLRSGFQALKRLTSFLFYSVTDDAGMNPLWPRIGYAPSPLPSARAEPLRLTRVGRSTTLDCDVCVVGSGAGGGVVAAELASRGMSVIVLEAGPGDQASDFVQRELDGIQRLYHGAGLTSTRDASIAILAGACLGGGTAVNWQTSLRTPDFVRDEWSHRSGTELFRSDEFTQALDDVSERIGVSTDESIVNGNNACLERGCTALGFDHERIPRNARGCDPSQCGYCAFGCRIGGKRSTTVTYLHDAQRLGDTRIIADCHADRVTIAAGRVTGVRATARSAAGESFDLTVRAPRVIVCAGSIESPALLQRSGITLAELGENLYLHPTSAAAGEYAEPIEAWKGPPQTVMSGELARLSGHYGVRFETAPAHVGLMALGAAWTSAGAHRRTMQRAAHTSAIIVLTRDGAGGRVRARRDGSVAITYRPGSAERALLARGIAAAARLHWAAGAEEVHTLHTRGLSLTRSAATTQHDIDRFCERIMAERVDANWSTLFSAHQMGTCRMGRDERTAVCDDRGEVFGARGLYVADASAFPASSGVNPMITVMALALCVARRIAAA